MVAIHEYRIPLPFTVDEYEIAQLYMVAKYSASESTGDNGDGVEILINEPFEDEGRKGQYTHKVYHLASKLPGWLVSLLPKKALILEEEAWNAYPHCTTILKCPFLNKFKLVLDSTHLTDTGTTENALKLDVKTLKRRQVEYIDIAMDQPERYVEEEDPTLFKSKRTGRGPFLQGWREKCEPVMCAYKCVTVDVPYWGFGSRIEKFIAKNAQRKILLEGHRKCVCWLDEWFGLTMEDIRRMEQETAEAIRRARTMALKRAEALDYEDLPAVFLDEDSVATASLADTMVDSPAPRKRSHSAPTWAKQSPLNRSRELASPSTRSKPSLSLVGPSFSVGISTLSASELDQAPSLQSLPGSKRSNSLKGLTPTESEGPLFQSGSCESFNDSSHLNSGDWEVPYYSLEDQSSAEVSKCVDVLDRVISWTKALRLRRSGKNGTLGTGIVAPVDSSGEMRQEERTEPPKDPEGVDQYISVLNFALSAVKWKPSKVKLV